MVIAAAGLTKGDEGGWIEMRDDKVLDLPG